MLVADSAAAILAEQVDAQVATKCAHERGINRHGNGKRIVQRTTTQVGCVHLVRANVVLDHTRKCAARHGARARPTGNVAARQHHAMRHVKTNHGEFAARAQHGVSGLGVARHVGLGTGAHVAGHGQGATHHHHAADRHHRRRVALKGERQVGERTGRHIDQVGTIGTRGINQVIDRRIAIGRRRAHRLVRRGGHACAADAVLAVDKRGGRRRRVGFGRLHGTIGAQVHRHLGTTQQVEHRQAVVRRLLDAHVAKARGDADELHLGARDGIGKRHRIIHTHIQIKDQLLGCHCSTPLLRLHPNRLNQTCARLPHAWELIAERPGATPSPPRRERPPPCTQRAAGPPGEPRQAHR